MKSAFMCLDGRLIKKWEHSMIADQNGGLSLEKVYRRIAMAIVFVSLLGVLITPVRAPPVYEWINDQQVVWHCPSFGSHYWDSGEGHFKVVTYFMGFMAFWVEHYSDPISDRGDIDDIRIKFYCKPGSISGFYLDIAKNQHCDGSYEFITAPSGGGYIYRTLGLSYKGQRVHVEYHTMTLFWEYIYIDHAWVQIKVPM